ncbi:MAG: biotin/lipoyl-binding protein, partial [Gammaproteobacteria bacterium]
MASKRLKLISYGLIVLILIGALIAYLGSSKAVKVIIRHVERGLVQDTVANTRAGTIKACNRAGLSPSMGGQIANLPVKVGDAVKPGQILMELWNDDRVAEVSLATREARAAKALARQACINADVAEREGR